MLDGLCVETLVEEFDQLNSLKAMVWQSEDQFLKALPGLEKRLASLLSETLDLTPKTCGLSVREVLPIKSVAHLRQVVKD